ncbi:MAG: Methyltransferase type 12 [Proteobacteria bacterium]|nr:Methyltransferase type 12 [Pseudomonadota bacterium]
MNFDSRAKTWDDDPMKTARAEAVAREIRAQVTLTPQMSALEYGCGTGLLSFALREQFKHLTLADSSSGMLAVLEGKIASGAIANMTALKLDLASDPLPRERFDLIHSLMTLHHIDDTDALLHALYALLKSPGYLCLADLDSEDGSFHGADFHGHRGFDRETLRRQASDAGFRNIRFTTVFTIRKAVASGGEKDFPVFLLVAEKP